MKLFSQDTTVKALKRAPLFEGLSRKELVQLARMSDDLEVPAGRLLCNEGDRGRVGVLEEGRVRATGTHTHLLEHVLTAAA
jgi:hypothetical protein